MGKPEETWTKVSDGLLICFINLNWSAAPTAHLRHMSQETFQPENRSGLGPVSGGGGHILRQKVVDGSILCPTKLCDMFPLSLISSTTKKQGIRSCRAFCLQEQILSKGKRPQESSKFYPLFFHVGLNPLFISQREKIVRVDTLNTIQLATYRDPCAITDKIRCVWNKR